MPDTRHEHEGLSRFARLRLLFGALFLSVTGLLAWRRPRRRAEAAAQQRRERAARIARLRGLGHEPNDVAVGPFVAIALAIILFAIASHLGLWAFMRAAADPIVPPATGLLPLEAPVQHPGGALPTATVVPLPARLPVLPEGQQQLQTQGEERLHSYGWVDQGAGVVHIPIDRAIDLVIERGLPTREGP